MSELSQEVTVPWEPSHQADHLLFVVGPHEGSNGPDGFVAEVGVECKYASHVLERAFEVELVGEDWVGVLHSLELLVLGLVIPSDCNGPPEGCAGLDGAEAEHREVSRRVSCVSVASETLG